ncbi:hypothetical protein MTF65_12995 [Streptomyces sp. APSN-46.1]|uniref:hypothetical protein n=1 Tax=Streptomyces sp. APSN-46.1 TaxID=2929049 RepID=UPI001FB3754B|nr:hypothetical protein [Streptomyces sp. APSN-46.1]MCJ1678247.1 hypothetical protein [Streptomyces sp. APSN-46.1]
MKDQRSGSQILYGFLPQQTADLKGGIWRTTEWKDPRPVDVEDAIIRSRLIAELKGWVDRGLDATAVNFLRSGGPIEVVAVNPERGVRVERFPLVWVCRTCRRVETGAAKTCPCGSSRWQQLHFVGFHDCGLLEQPVIPMCREHHQVRMPHQSSMDASRIRFECPVCQKEIQKGFGWRKCPCGRRYSDAKNGEYLRYNVHRSASVYTPQTFTQINPASRAAMRRITESGGPRRALTWALGGFEDSEPGTGRQTETSLVDQLVASGLTRSVAEKMAAVAGDAGELGTEEDLGALANAADPQIEAAEREAVDVALAATEKGSRQRVADLITPTSPPAALTRYEVDYPAALRRAGLAGVDLFTDFPVLKAVYGYTRGGGEPGNSRLSLFTGKIGRRVYADLRSTEALFFRLDPLLVLAALRQRGHVLPPAADARAARAILAAHVTPPSRFSDPEDAAPPGRDLLTLIHSYAHRAVRQLAVFAGVDREGLGEYLIPRHSGFFIFAASRGDFVLGGLQAVFENDLHILLNTIAGAESRCAMDPACARNGGACPACLHLGEPACDHFNRYLDRTALFGPDGFLAASACHAP